MGGVKRKAISQMEMERKQRAAQAPKKGKPAVEKKSRGLSLPSLSDDVFKKELAKMGAVTPYGVATRFDLRLGIAKRLLRDLEKKNILVPVGGNERIRIYKAVGA